MQPPEIERLLPGVIQRTIEDGTPLRGLIDVMSALQAPSEAALETLDANFDPRRAPERFVPFLARWVNLDVRVTTGLGRQRELIAAAAQLAQWRGTAKGLIRFLTIGTGVEGFRVEEQFPDETGAIRPFHVRIRAPLSTAAHRAMIEQIIEREKPAYVTYELRFDDAPPPLPPRR